MPTDPSQVAGYCAGLTMKAAGHLEFQDPKAFHAGFTTTFPPNTRVAYGTYDVDFDSNAEKVGAVGVTYAAVTSRSHHSGGVNVLLMDGSVHFVANGISTATWRALGTRSGGEVIGSDF